MNINKKKSNKNIHQTEIRTPKIIGLGLIKIDFYINLTEEMIKEHEIDFHRINSPKDLLFILENPALLNQIQISTTDNLTNILLYINKANTQKSFVELITLNSLKFKPEEEFIRKLFSHVTEHNYLFTNEMSITNLPNKVSFAIKSGKKLLKYFDITTDYVIYSEQNKKDENSTFIKNSSSDELNNKIIQNNPNNNINNENSFNEDKELNDNIVIKRKENSEIAEKASEEDFNLEDVQNLNHENIDSNVNNPLDREKIATIYDKMKETSPIKNNENNGTKFDKSYNLDISRTNQSMYKLFNIPAACEIDEYDFIFIDVDEFLNFHGAGLHLIELADFLKKISLANKTPRIVINFPNILLNINMINLELIDIILCIMSFTDIFLFDKKECLAFFNMISQMNNEKELTEKNLNEHFLEKIPHLKKGVSKLGLFMEDLQTFNIIEQKGEKVIAQNEYQLNLHPKINHTNQKVIDEYKKIMVLNNNYFKSIFFGGYFSKYIFLEEHYSSFISGIESTKRILELFKNKIDFPNDQEFYIVKLQRTKIIKDIKLQKLRKKEEQFVLDCVNKRNASIKFYNPLFDEHLNAFFAGGVIRKQLKDKGFINTNGFVLYDSAYKNIEPSKNTMSKKRLNTSEKERNLLHAIKNNKDIFSTDLETYSKIVQSSSPTSRKLSIPSSMIKDSSNLYFSNKIQEMKNGSKRQLKPLYLASLSRKDEKILDSNLSNTKILQKPTSSIISKQKKTNVFPSQNYNNINKSHLNSVLNDSNLKDEKETSKVQNQSMIDSQIMEAEEKIHTNYNNKINNTQIAEIINEKNTENVSIKNNKASVKDSIKHLSNKEKESLKGSIKESVNESNKKSIKENTEINMEKEKDRQSDIHDITDNNNININNREKEVNSQKEKEIVEKENEEDKEVEIPKNKKEEEEAEGEN